MRDAMTNSRSAVRSIWLAFIRFKSEGHALCIAIADIGLNQKIRYRENIHSSIAIRTACPPLNHPLSDQPATSTEMKFGGGI